MGLFLVYFVSEIISRHSWLMGPKIYNSKPSSSQPQCNSPRHIPVIVTCGKVRTWLTLSSTVIVLTTYWTNEEGWTYTGIRCEVDWTGYGYTGSITSTRVSVTCVNSTAKVAIVTNVTVTSGNITK